jgi:hypothetical protein
MSKSTKKKNLKVRDLKPKKDAKGGGGHAVLGAAQSGSLKQGSAKTGSFMTGGGKAGN